MRVRYIIIAVVALAIVVAVGLGLVAANIDHYRPQIEAELQKKLDRQVTAGRLGLRLFPLSVRVDQLTINDDPAFGSQRPFATAKEVYVSVGLFSLFRGSPEVNSLSLDQPQIELIKNRSGVWNFSTIGGPQKTQGQGQQELTLGELKITDGQVAITDASVNQPRSVYDHIDLKLTDFAPGRQFGLDAGIHLPGEGKQLLSFQGKVGPLQPGNSANLPLSGHLSLQQVTLSAVNRLAQGTIPAGTDTVASGDADVTSQEAALSAKGNLKLENTVVKGAKLDYPITAHYDVTADRKQQTIEVRSGQISLGSTTFDVSGEMDSKTKPANVNLRLSTRDSSIAELAKLAGAFGVAFNASYQVKGSVSADVAAKGAMTAPALNGTISARNLDISGGEIKQPVSVPEVTLTLSPEVVRSNTFTAHSGATSLDVAFALSQYTSPNPTVDATVKTDGANIAELLNVAKAYGVHAADGITGSGKLSANVHVQGPVKQTSNLAFAGAANISGATLTMPTLAKPLGISSASAQFAQNSVSVTNLAASLGGTTVRGNLSAKNFAAPAVQFALAADKIDTADLQSVTTSSSQSGQTARRAPQPASSKTPRLLDETTGSGTLSAGAIKAQDLTLTNVHANCKLDRGVVTLAPLTANLYGGTENGTVSLDTRPAKPLCAVKTKLAGVDTNALLSSVSSVKNTLQGSLAADADLRFTLASSAELPATLNGVLTFNVTNGRLLNVNILNELSKIGKFLNAAPAQSSGSGTALKQLGGTMNITNGVASTNNLKAALDAGTMSANGSLNLVNEGIDMHMTAVLASGASQTVGGTHVGGFLNTALANNKGELVLPVLVTGTMAHPVFTPDVQALAKMRLQNLLPTSTDPSKLTSGILGGKGVGGILNGVLGGGAAAPNSAKQPGNNQQQQSPLDSILGQFGKKKKQ